MQPDLLLDNEASPFERAVIEGMTDDLPVALLDAVNPAETPSAFLPFLAAHESVDLWLEEWSEERKREMVAEAPLLARKKGTRAGARRFLYYVDGTLLDVIAYPAPFIMGRARIGRTPIGHKAFVARYLVKVLTLKRPRSFVMSRSLLNRDRLNTADRTPLLKALGALRVAKAPETEVRVDFAHHRQPTLDDGLPLDPGFEIGAFAPRSKL